MTLVLSSVFDDDSVLVLSDSRASSGSTSEDVLQKIVGINKDVIVGYAGVVAAVNRALISFQQEITARTIAAPQSIAVMQEKCSDEFTSNAEKFSILLFTKEDVKWSITRLEFPNFEPEPIDDIALIGSGSVISPQIVPFYETIKDGSELTKTKADRIVWQVSSLLASSGAQGVGGMIQALLLLPDGVRTLHTGFIDMNPEVQGDSKEIKFENGRWVQHDHRLRTQSVIIAPNELLQQPVHERVFHNYERASGSNPSKWYVNSFLIAQNVELDYFSAKFTNQFTSLACEEFPQVMPAWAYLSVWGPSTQHTIELIHINPNNTRSTLYTGMFDNIDFPMDYEFLEEISITVDAPGKHYLECWIDGELAGHKLFFVTVSSPDLPAVAKAYNHNAAYQRAVDDRLTGSELTYFFVGNERADHQPMALEAKGQFKVAYYSVYPITMVGYANFGVRSSPGEHEFEIILMDAATHEVITNTGSTLECSSTTFTKPVEASFDLVFPKKGFYFVLLKIDGVLKGCTILMADGNPPITYNLPDDGLETLRNNGFLLLAKRAVDTTDS